MKLDELEKMAKETAAFGVHPSGEFIYSFYTEQLQAFAKLVAAKERRNCVDTLAFHGEISKDDDSEWSEVVFWCCSRINNPIPTDKTLAPNYKQIDNARGQV
jgi:hypothetical protein